MNKIDLFTFVYADLYKYAELFHRSCEAMKSGDVEINYKCIESISMDKKPEGYKRVATTGKSNKGDSFNHSIAVNEAFNHIESKYVIFADADVAITYKDWDKVVIDKLDSGLSCFGFDYYRKSRRYFNFPNIYFFAFNNELISDVNLDFRPRISNGKIDDENIDTDQKSYLSGKPFGEYIKCDTGWNVPFTIKGAGLKGESIPCFRSDTEGQILPFRNDKQKKLSFKKHRLMNEFIYNGELFGTHLKRCRFNNYDSKYGKIWRDRISLYFNKKYGIKFE